MKKSTLKTIDICYISLFSALIALCAWISIPAAVPFTMQIFGVFATIQILGGRRGTFSILVYLLLGAVGLPVFSGFTGGIGRIFGSSGGYILGYLLMALLYWFLEGFIGTKTGLKILVLVLCLMLNYAVGTFWFVAVYTANTGAIDYMTALFLCVTPYIIPDLLKLVLSHVVYTKIRQYVKP